MNVSSAAEAYTILEKLPLGQAKLMEFDLVELTPLTLLHMLLTEVWANGSSSASPNSHSGSMAIFSLKRRRQ